MRNPTIKSKFSRDDGFRKVPFADEIWDDIHVVAIHHMQNVAQTRFFLPKRTMHFCKNVASDDLVSVLKGRGARIWIQCRPVANEDQRAAPFIDHLLNFDGSENSSNSFRVDSCDDRGTRLE
jgi:hypothetical protein